MYTPAWITFEIEQALKGMSRKRRTTVLKLADAATDPKRSMSDVFRDPDCCNRSTWYDRPGRLGWEKDAKIRVALVLATERAQKWQDTEIARNIVESQRLLAEAAPKAVRRLILLVDNANDEKLQRGVALDILDRVGTGETASKGMPVQGGGVIVYVPDNGRDTSTGGSPDPVSGDAG